jgi:hypothetical protein
MTTQATSLLGLALPITGELDGTWGDVVNDSITSLVDSAIAGATTLTVDADVTLSTTTLASNQARQAIIVWSASGTVTRYITAPASSKTYVVINNTGGTQAIVIRGVGPTTGVSIFAGGKALVAWNGTDFVRVGASAGGADTQVQFNSSDNLAGSLNFTWDGNAVQIGGEKALRFADADSSNYVGLKSPAVVATSTTYTLPSVDGSPGQNLTTNGTGGMSWATAGAAATGAIWVNNTTVSTDYTIATNTNGFSVGPITIASGYAVTVASGQRWLVF